MSDNCYEYVEKNLSAIRENIAETAEKYGRNTDSVRLMAVTKTVPPDIVNYAVSLGIDLLGENKVQEFLSKQPVYNKAADVHFIGHLQTNKVKYIIENVSLIQSVDSLKLAHEINRLAIAHNKIMDVLCEVNIGGEVSKSGVPPENLIPLIEQISLLQGVRVKGLMTIPPPSNCDVFLGKMEELFNKVKSANIENVSMDELSMGMSGDYQQAIIHGSTIVRIGTGLFGKRIYN